LLSEEQAQGFFNFPDRAQFYLEFLGVKALHIVAWNDDMAETEFFGLGNALLYACNGAHFARQSHLSSHAPAGFYGGVDIGREYCGYHAEVGGKVGNAQSAGNVDEHIFLHKLEAYALFEYGKKHVEPALVEASGRPLWCAVWLEEQEKARLVIAEAEQAKRDLACIKSAIKREQRHACMVVAECEQTRLKAKAETKTEELKSSTLVACLSKNSATKTATSVLNGVNSLFGGNKVKRLEKENAQLHREIEDLNDRIER